jgi:hypothetical protein
VVLLCFTSNVLWQDEAKINFLKYLKIILFVILEERTFFKLIEYRIFKKSFMQFFLFQLKILYLSNKWFYWNVKFLILIVSLKDFLKLILLSLSFAIKVKNEKRYRAVSFQLNIY